MKRRKALARGKPPRRGKPPVRSNPPRRSYRSRARRRKISDRQWEKVKRWVRCRDGWNCAARVLADDCTNEPDHVHHLRPVSQGGTDNEANLLTVCHGCHEWIHEHPSIAYDRGLLIR